MARFKPSVYQKAVFDFIINGEGNAVVNAVAGSGKTTTIVNALELIDETKVIYFLAFGKAIAEEIRSRVPSYVNVSTFHSLGARALAKSRNSRLDTHRVNSVVSQLRDQWQNASELPINGDYLSRVYRLVDLYRSNLCEGSAELNLIAQKHGIEVVNGEVEKSMEVMSFLNRMTDTHDFTDMLYIPATDDNITFPKADWVFVDEAQDLNKAQQALLMKLMKPGSRFVAVGDPHQAIFGFAGADADSFDILRNMPNTIELPLSMNYRCSKAVLDLMRQYVPAIHIEACDDAPEGTANPEETWKAIGDGDMVLCRNTAPLIKMCLEFIKSKRKAYVKGGDMGKQLANIVTRSNARTITDFELFMKRELSTVFERLRKSHPYMDSGEIKQEPAYLLMEERIQVFETIIDSASCGTPSQLINWINDLFADSKTGICFSSAHRSKGLENERVFVIEFGLMPSPYAKKDWQLLQEYNLIYVALTRAKMHTGIVTDWSFKKLTR